MTKQYPANPQTLGQHILKARLDRKLTQKAVSEYVGVCHQVIRLWENDTCYPDCTHMKKVIEFVGYYPLPEPDSLGDRIRKYRYVHGLNLEEFGQLVDVDGATVWTWENGKYTPGEATVKKIQNLINQKELSK